MGKIFGISDLPVSTIMTPFEPIVVPKPQHRQIDRPKQLASEGDRFASTSLPKKKSKAFLAMRNGIGKLLKPFSKKLVK